MTESIGTAAPTLMAVAAGSCSGAEKGDRAVFGCEGKRQVVSGHARPSVNKHALPAGTWVRKIGGWQSRKASGFDSLPASPSTTLVVSSSTLRLRSSCLFRVSPASVVATMRSKTVSSRKLAYSRFAGPQHLIFLGSVFHNALTRDLQNFCREERLMFAFAASGNSPSTPLQRDLDCGVRFNSRIPRTTR